MNKFSQKTLILALVIFALVIAGGALAYLKLKLVEPIANQNINNISDLQSIRWEEKDLLDPILNTLRPTDDGEAYVMIRKVGGNFAFGSTQVSPGGGYEWYAKKIDGQWKIFLRTQEEPFCSVLKNNGVPVTFYTESCWLDDGKNTIPYSSY